MQDSADSNRFMDYLLFRSLKGHTTDSEEERVLEWRRSALENETYYRELAQLLALTAEGYHAPDASPGAPPDGAELLARSGINAGFGFGRPRRSRGHSSDCRFRTRASVAAGVAAAAIAAVLVLRAAAPGPEDSLSFGADEFATGKSDVATIHLRDGTLIRLAPASRLRVTGSLGAREVTLKGRAYFAVARIDGDPFIVKTRAGEAVVLGTRFDLEARGDEIRLVVVEGRVALAAAQNRIELSAGEMGRAVEGTLSAPIWVPDVYRELEWTGDFLAFQRTPIEQVAVEIGRHFGIRVDVLGSDLDGQTVTAAFADSGIEDVLGVVCRVLTARCSLEADHARVDLTRSSDPARRAIP